ncbi:hypothetical protein ACJJTC_003649 [Scirpophaga incertulas]
MLSFCELTKWLLIISCKSLKRRFLVLLFVSCAFILSIKWKYMCLNTQPKHYLQKICSSFENGKSVGNLCEDLCMHDEISSLSCQSYLKKDAVFSAIWKNKSVVLKTVKKSIYHFENDISENTLALLIKSNVRLKFNISIDILDAKRLSYTQYNQKGYKRVVEKQNVWSLLQNNEYLALSLYDKYNIFPKLFGSCGRMFAVENLKSISGYWHLMTLYDSRAEWERRVKISLMILDYLKLLEERLPEPLHLCYVTMNNFGVSNDFKKVMFLNLDYVHPLSVVSTMTANGAKCKKHSDCDFVDCRSLCNFITFRCQYGVVNNNLQIVCEKIFLGWMLSGKAMVPGLLLGPRTPRVLTEILENCANPASETETPRAQTEKEIRKRLYDLLSHLVTA